MKKRLIGIVVSLGLIAVLWSTVDFKAIVDAAHRADPLWFWAAIAMVVPLTLGTSERFRVLADGSIGLGTSIRLILSASTLNLVLPSKMGDIAKAWVLRQRDGMGDARALSLVVFEKMLDMMSLLAMGTVALLVAGLNFPGAGLALLVVAGGAAALFCVMIPGLMARLPLRRLIGDRQLPAKVEAVSGAWSELTRSFWADRGKAFAILAGSLLIWVGHLFQIWLFARAIAPTIPFAETATFGTLAILAGLLPFTFAGVGTRDAALVLLFAPWLNGGEAALLGLFATLRYVLPAIAGLPFVGDYWKGRAAPAQ